MKRHISVTAGGSAAERRILQLRTGDSVVVADSGTGVRGTVVALPGLKGSDLGLRAVCAPLVSRGHRVVSVNLPGMGLSASVPGRRYSFPQLVDIVDEVVEAIGLDAGPVVVLGHSFGATLAMAVARRRDAGLRGLLLVSPVVVPVNDQSGMTERLSRTLVDATATILSQVPAGLGRRLIRSQLIDALSTAVLAQRGVSGFRRIRAASSSERFLAPDPSVVASHLQAAARHGCAEFSADIKVSTWIIAGTADNMSPVEDLHWLRDALNARLDLIPGAGHLAHHEDVDAITEGVERAIEVLSLKVS